MEMRMEVSTHLETELGLRDHYFLQKVLDVNALL